MATCLSGGDGERVLEGVSILEGDALAASEGLAVVNDAVVEAEAAEEVGIDELGGREPATRDMDVGGGGARALSSPAQVYHLHAERRDPVRQRCRLPLQNR